jgi:hypothetical protein
MAPLKYSFSGCNESKSEIGPTIFLTQNSELPGHASLLADLVGGDPIERLMSLHGHNLFPVGVDRMLSSFAQKPEPMPF